MPVTITSLCLRDGACITVCPVNCIVPGKPVEMWPNYYVEREICITCSSCISECPNGAIFYEEDVPTNFIARGGERLSMPENTTGFHETYHGIDHSGEDVILTSIRTLIPGDLIDLSPAVKNNSRFFSEGPGFAAME